MTSQEDSRHISGDLVLFNQAEFKIQDVHELIYANQVLASGL